MYNLAVTLGKMFLIVMWVVWMLTLVTVLAVRGVIVYANKVGVWIYEYISGAQTKH